MLKNLLGAGKEQAAKDQEKSIGKEIEGLPVGTRNEEVRDLWIAAAIKEIPSEARILDAGAGELKYKQYCSHLRYVSQDFCRYDGLGNQRGIQTGSWNNSGIDIVSDIMSIPEPDESFDAILCIEVLEHLPSPEGAIKEFSRLLKKRGLLILTAPFCSLTHFAPYHFSTGFNRYYYERILPQYQFEIQELSENGNFFEFIAQELRRMPELGKKYCSEYLNAKEEEALHTILATLQRCSDHDNASKEMLCFGYQVKAIKK